jgi:serine/threonine protein kinase
MEVDRQDLQESNYQIVPGYTPPEQAKGRAVPQSDYFSLGRTFVYLLTGKSPEDFMEDPRTGELLWQHRATHLSPGFTDVIDYLMATLPGNRPHNAQMILMRLSTLDYAPQKTSVSSGSSLSVSGDRSTERALLRARTVKRRQQFNYDNLWKEKSRSKRLKVSKSIIIFLVGGIVACLAMVLVGIVTETITPDWIEHIELQGIRQQDEN